MSTKFIKPASGTLEEAGAALAPPFVGALLRLCWQRVRDRIQEAVAADGFSDLQEAHLVVFSYPLPDRVRPADLARQLRMSRQATNYLVNQLETMGYLERRAEADGERRLIYFTKRGWQVAETIYASLRQLQREWAEEVGQERFADFMGVLRQLAAPKQPPDS